MRSRQHRDLGRGFQGRHGISCASRDAWSPAVSFYRGKKRSRAWWRWWPFYRGESDIRDGGEPAADAVAILSGDTAKPLRAIGLCVRVNACPIDRTSAGLSVDPGLSGPHTHTVGASPTMPGSPGAAYTQ